VAKCGGTGLGKKEDPMKPSELCAEALHKAGVAADLDLSALAYMIAEHSRCDDYAYAMAVDALVHWRHGEYDISLTWAKRLANVTAEKSLISS
jgi:hypothetical protein